MAPLSDFSCIAIISSALLMSFFEDRMAALSSAIDEPRRDRSATYPPAGMLRTSCRGTGKFQK